MVVVCAVMAAPASASQSVFDWLGSSGSAAGQFGGEPEELGGAVSGGAAGLAVNDTTGDVYVSDRADNRISQFDSSGAFVRAWGIDVIPGGAAGTGALTSGSTEVTSVVTTSRAFVPGQEITGAGIPAGTQIAKLSTGVGAASKLFLSKKATASGSGVTLAVAEGSGNVPQNEQQIVRVSATGGTFKLSISTKMPTASAQTGSIAYNAPANGAGSVQGALEGILGAGNVEVTGANGGPYTVEFKGVRFADTNVAPMTTSNSLTGSGATSRVDTLVEGAGRAEKCTVATTCQAGTASGIAGGMGRPNSVAIDQGTGNVYVTDETNVRVDEFDSTGNFIRAWGVDVVESGPGNKPEIQSVNVVGSSGTFVLKFEGKSLTFSAGAGAAEIETAFNALTSVGGSFGSVSVSGTAPYQLTFGGLAFANRNMQQVELDATGLGVPVGTEAPCTAGPVSGATLGYEWLRNGVATGATSATYTTVAADAGQAIQCKVKATNGDGATVQTSSTRIVVSPFPATTPPLPGSVTITGTATVGQILTCAKGTWTGTSIPFAFQWLRNGVPIAGKTAETYTLEAADNQTAIQCEVTGGNAGGSLVADSPLKLIRSEPPANTGAAANVPQITVEGGGAANVGATLKCSNGTWTGSGISFAFQWLRNGAAISGANSNAYTTVALDEKAAVQCLVTATNAGGSASSLSANTVVGPAIPNPTPPIRSTLIITSVSGTRNVGQTLTCNEGTWTPASPAPSFSFQWLRNGAEISGATSKTYLLTAADLDKLVQCRVIASNAGGSAMGISNAAAAGVIVKNPPSATSSVAPLSSVSTVRDGAGFEICNAPADACQAFSGGLFQGTGPGFGVGFFGSVFNGHLAIAPAGPYAGDLFVADVGDRRIEMFSPSGAFVGAFGKAVGGVGKNLCLVSNGDVCKAGATTGGGNFGTTYVFEESYGFANLTSLSNLTTSGERFAFDSSGNIYVINGGSLQKYSADLLAEKDVAKYQCSDKSLTSEYQRCTDVAIDPHTGDIYIAYGIPTAGGIKETAIARVDSNAGEPTIEGVDPAIERMLLGAEILRTNGIAIDGSTGSLRSGRVYFSTATPEQRVDVLGEPTPPTVEMDEVEPNDVEAHAVTVSGTINPNGNKTHTEYRFETLLPGNPWVKYPIPNVDLGNGTAPQTVEQTIPGLRANTDYQVRLTAVKDRPYSSPAQSFTTLPAGPDVETGVARWSGPPSSKPSLTFSGQIDDNNLPVHFFFEYGANESYGARVPIYESGTHPAAQASFRVRGTVNGLDPSASYHYRLVAHTQSGTSSGADHEVGPSQAGIAYPELVSPVDKGVATVGLSIPFDNQPNFQLSENGEALAYSLYSGDSKATAGGDVLELASRDPAHGWENTQLTPPSTEPPSPYGGVSSVHAEASGPVAWLSPELDCAIVQSAGALTPDISTADLENSVTNLFRRDSAGNYTRMTPTPLEATTGGATQTYYVRFGAADCNRIIFETSIRLLPGGPAEPQKHVYEWESGGGPNGTIRFLDILPDGSLPPAGGGLGTGQPTLANGENIQAVSDDLSRVFFGAVSTQGGDAGHNALFVRKNHAVTVDVSQSQTATANTGTTRYAIATPSGSHVFFTAMSGLASNGGSTGAATCSSGGSGCDLYDYNVNTGSLADLTPDTNPSDTQGAQVTGVYGASDDGSYIYFAAQGQLVAGKGQTFAQNQVNGHFNLYVAHAGALSYVGENVGSSEDESYESSFVTEAAYSLQSRVSPSGKYLVFHSKVNLTPYNSGGASELYRYSAPEGSVQCVSCRTDGQLPHGSQYQFLRPDPLDQQIDSYFPRAISDDGRQVLFTTSDKLTPDAIEGNPGPGLKGENAYEWHDGVVRLLAAHGNALDMSADGSDVFVITKESLVPQDQDFQPDIYDFRLDGGFPYFPPEPCDPLSENSCQGTPPTPPPPTTDPASSTFTGPGNPAVSNPKAKHPKKHHKHHKRSHKRAKRNLGGVK
jgi:hypothetical protein